MTPTSSQSECVTRPLILDGQFLQVGIPPSAGTDLLQQLKLWLTVEYTTLVCCGASSCKQHSETRIVEQQSLERPGWTAEQPHYCSECTHSHYTVQSMHWSSMRCPAHSNYVRGLSRHRHFTCWGSVQQQQRQSVKLSPAEPQQTNLYRQEQLRASE